jgi:glycosyltransferase involved in cell wall biosynthesis
LGSVDDAGKYIRGADIVLVPVKNSGGVKIRLLESLLCGKPIIASSEAVTGLPDEIKNCIIIADTPDEFIESIVDCKNRSIQPDVSIVDKYFTHEGFENFLNYISSLRGLQNDDQSKVG